MTTARARVRPLGPLVAMLLAIAGALTTVTAAQASTEFSTERLVGYVVGAPPPDTLRALV